MAIHINDKLQRTFRGLNADSRFTTWLWFFIKFHSPQAYLGADSTPFGHSAHADPDTCSTIIRTGS
ncbi:hypothetical protein PN353_028020, partial [Pseudomonas aeruginosa]